jgi:Uma2 family endonuclease
MPATAELRRKRPAEAGLPPSLQNGDRLTTHEFLRRYEAMPEIKKAELVQGIVYMGSPVSTDHSEPDGLIQLWLATYAAMTPGVKCYPNTTVILGPANTPQPDACLCLPARGGGHTRLNEKNYLVGPPELVAEIAASSASLDLGDKMESYAMAGVREYLVWRTLERGFDWFALEDAEYAPVKPDAHGCLRSGTFPGLVLDVRALLARQAAKVLAVLQRGLASAAHKSFVTGLR